MQIRDTSDPRTASARDATPPAPRAPWASYAVRCRCPTVPLGRAVSHHAGPKWDALNRNVLTFSTSLGLISDHSVDGHFSYDLQISHYGGDPHQFFSGLEPVVIPRPAAKDQCKHGGWKRFGFNNQGQCIRFVKHGPKQ